MEFGMILHVASKQGKSNSYSQEAHGFGGAIKAILKSLRAKWMASL